MTQFGIQRGGISKTATYLASRILDTWVNHDWSDGLQLEAVEDFTEIHVQTRNSLYEITAIEGFSSSLSDFRGPELNQRCGQSVGMSERFRAFD